MTRETIAPDRATALIVGVGGIGAPAAWALARAGVSRLVLVDPDVVDLSNLPRQILYAAADVGRPKAETAAERLRGPGTATVAVVAAVDAENGPALFARADVVVDGTDGAAAKDLVNALAVRAGVPLVHAAAIQSEGRLLDVPPGGKPCLSCLFGTTSADGTAGDTCASVGVWNGVTGVVGFLAAQAALARLADPTAPSKGLRVIDLAEGRGVTLNAAPDPRCAVCGGGAATAPPKARSPVQAAHGRALASVDALDLTSESCPMNLLLARRAVDRLPRGAEIEILLGAEGAETVPDGLRSLGHELVATEPLGAGLRLVVRAMPRVAPPPAARDDWLRRYARQIVLPEIGEAGQRRIGDARVRVTGSGDAAEAATTYLRAAGVGSVERTAGETRDVVASVEGGRPSVALAGDGSGGVQLPSADDGAARPADGVPPRGPIAMAGGALVADALLRRIVGSAAPPGSGADPSPRIAIAKDATVRTRPRG